MTTIRLPAAGDPAVSLVMVVYGHADQARSTLASLADTLGSVAAEVVVVDNASPDGAGARLRDELDGATFLLQERNLGFGTAVDLGALHGRGRYVGILNSDLTFEDRWLDELVAALDDDPRAGAAVPMYLSDAGAITEAGVLVGADGRGYGYGDRLSGAAPEVGFRRYVDYGSAAAMLVRREAFDRVGGLDPVYGLGYYEDADLCFSLREIGFETLFVPRSRVRHAGGGSFPSRLRDEQSARNRPIFVERFGRRLRGRPLLARPPYDPHKELVVRDWSASDRLLVLDPAGRLASFADAVQARWPLARVTSVSEGRVPSGGDERVERVADLGRLDRWLEERRFHYGAVVHDASLPGELSAWLDHSQPQAWRGVFGGDSPLADVVLPERPDPLQVMPALGFGRA